MTDEIILDVHDLSSSLLGGFTVHPTDVRGI
jgi:hypothetical protein